MKGWSLLLAVASAFASPAVLPAEPFVSLEADIGTMYADRNVIRVSYNALRGRDAVLIPLTLIEFERDILCEDGRPDCGTHTNSNSWLDVTLLIDAIEVAKQALAQDQVLLLALHPPKVTQCSSLPVFTLTGFVQTRPGEKQILVKVGSSEFIAFDVDAIDQFRSMLVDARALQRKLQPQVDAFNAAAPQLNDARVGDANTRMHKPCASI